MQRRGMMFMQINLRQKRDGFRGREAREKHLCSGRFIYLSIKNLFLIDNFPKFEVSMDDVRMSHKGILHLNIFFNSW